MVKFVRGDARRPMVQLPDMDADDDIPEVLNAIRAGVAAGRAREAAAGLKSPALAHRAEQHSAEACRWLAQVPER